MPVYFVESLPDGPIKIGWTRAETVNRRLSDLRVTSPSKLRLIVLVQGTRATERFLHEAMAHHRLHGEWFEREAVLALLRAGDILPTPGVRHLCSAEHAAPPVDHAWTIQWGDGRFRPGEFPLNRAG